MKWLLITIYLIQINRWMILIRESRKDILKTVLILTVPLDLNFEYGKTFEIETTLQHIK